MDKLMNLIAAIPTKIPDYPGLREAGCPRIATFVSWLVAAYFPIREKKTRLFT